MVRSRIVSWALGAMLAGLAAAPALATGGVYPQTAHGDPTTGALRLQPEVAPRGDCAHCHDEHASRSGVANGGPFPYALFAIDDNNLCAAAGGAGGCHANPGAKGIYQAKTAYDLSLHATSSMMIWPGPVPRARQSGEAGYCVNCHAPHGRTDTSGLIPSLLAVREEKSCDGCHGPTGPATTDIASELIKIYRHPIAQLSGLHQAGESTRAAFAPPNRHSECEDCHNPHDVRPDTVAPTPPIASNRNQRVSRVAVTNGPAGAIPTYTFFRADDPAPVNEYEICFKCHSSWTTQPASQRDMALLLNPNNRSYHPVEAAGKNVGIPDAAFTGGFTATALTYCDSCHGTDSTVVVGPHGSNYQKLLRADYNPAAGFRATASTEVCFLCHLFDTYANGAAPDSVKGASRFNPPAFENGHAFHVAEEHVPCYDCHDSHGVPDQPALIVVGQRTPGLLSYTQTPTGGTCTPTCHSTESYGRVNYPR